jgi:hypothetical protein
MYWKNIKWYIPVVILIPALWYLPGITGRIPYPSDTAQFTDLLITHHPYAILLRNALVDYQVFPLWSDLIYSGMPFASNPLAGLFYLPGWLALLFPLPAGISVVLALHVVLGTWGFYIFLKNKGLDDPGALLGALAFGVMPKIASHYGAGHVTLIYALAWTPWLFVARKFDTNGWVLGAMAGMLFLADPRWAVYAGLLWLTYEIAHRQYEHLKDEFYYLLKMGLAALLVAAPLILPLLEFSGLSTRSTLTTNEMLENSLPVEMLLGLVVPGSGGNVEWAIYAGGVSLSLFFIQLTSADLRKRNGFWNIWVGLSLILSLGAIYNTADWLSKIPVISLLRVPARALFLTGFSFAVISAQTLHGLIKSEINQRSVKRALYVSIVFSLLMLSSFIIYGYYQSVLSIWGFLIVALSSILIYIFLYQSQYKNLAWFLIAIAVIDLVIVGFSFFNLRNVSELDRKFDRASCLTDSDDHVFRLYSPSYAISQDIAAEQYLELADGVDPMQLEKYRSFMEDATGVDVEGYGVSIPPYKSGNPRSDNKNAVLNVNLISLLNVKYIVSDYAINQPKLEQISDCNGLYVYKNITGLPRAWVDPLGDSDIVTIPNKEEILKVEILEKKPNSIRLEAKGPGRLVLSEIYYPGWSATVDGEVTELVPFYDIFRSVLLDEGTHEIKFTYHPLPAYLGIVIASGFWLSMALSLSRKLL